MHVYRYAPGKMDWLESGLAVEGQFAHGPRAGDLARKDVPTCRLDERIGEARRRAEGWPVCVVVTEQKIVLGLLRLQALALADDQQTVEQVMEPGPRTYRRYVDPANLKRYFDKHPDSAGVLVTTAVGELIGVVLRADVERIEPHP
jgi:Mg/Co/Ni transporter MgtE